MSEPNINGPQCRNMYIWYIRHVWSVRKIYALHYTIDTSVKYSFVYLLALLVISSFWLLGPEYDMTPGCVYSRMLVPAHVCNNMYKQNNGHKELEWLIRTAWYFAQTVQQIKGTELALNPNSHAWAARLQEMSMHQHERLQRSLRLDPKCPAITLANRYINKHTY